MIYTLSGTNHFMLQQRMRQLTDDFLRQNGDFGLTKLAGDEATFEQLQEAMLSLPFLSLKKLVIVRQPSLQKTFVERAETLLPQVDDAIDVILIEPKLDKRQSYYKTLQKQTQFEVFTELDGQALARWLVATAKELGGSISPTTAQSLIRRLGADQQLLFQELQKLVHYEPTITAETIELLTDSTPQSSIFDLIETAVQGNAKKAMALYDEQRQARIEPAHIIAMFTWQLQILAVIQAAGSRTPAEIAKEAGISPYTVTKSVSLAHRLSAAALRERIATLLEIDMRSKSSAIDTDQALRHYILTWSTISS